MPIGRLSLALAAAALLASSSALACDFSLLQEPAVKWETCSSTRFADLAGEHYGEGFTLSFDKDSFEKHYANIQKKTEVGDLDRDTHPYVYWKWMSPFLADHLPAYKKAAQVTKKKYPSVALP